MIFEREAVIHNENGVHARVAAMIVQKAQELCRKYGCRIFARTVHSQRIELKSLMMLIALKVSAGDSLFVAAEGEHCREALEEMVLFLEGDEACETSYKDRSGKYHGQTGITLPKVAAR